jgi:pimeloyl-ACP methyl ester carboxylesterase
MSSNLAIATDRPPTMFRERLPGPPDTDFLVRLPERLRAPAPILVSVHGLARNPLQNLVDLTHTADRLGAILIAPFFSKERHRGFQWLETWKGGMRADLVLNALIAKIAATYNGDPGRVIMFGFSGGGQFCHRFAMVHPSRVACVITVAAGWYTFPDEVAFPLGTNPDRSGRVQPDLNGFLRVPTLVAVGARDTERNASLNQRPEIDERQGPNRVVRAQRWVAAINAAAAARGVSPPPARMQLVKGTGHVLKECLTKRKFDDVLVEFATQCLDNRNSSIKLVP